MSVYPWDGDVSEDGGAIERAFLGKTVHAVEFSRFVDHVLRLEFTDGSSVELESWDYEGYKSGMYVRPLMASGTQS